MLLRSFYANQGKLRGFIFAATRDYHATEDILQEVAIVIARKASSFEAGREPLPWFMGIARHQIQQWYRDQGREAAHVSYEVLDDFMPLFASFEPEPISDRRIALRQCVEKLPDRQRRIVQLRYMDELDCAQIAGVIGRSVHGIYSLLKRLKRELRKCVELRLNQVQGGRDVC